MDFLKKFTESSAPKSETADKSGAPADQGQGDLLSSAQLVADAARSTIQKEPAKYKNAEVAGAAANLLDAAQTYGKLDKTAGVGSYVDKAENYLREYETSHTTKPKTTEEPATEETDTKPTTEEEPVAKPSSEEIPSQGQEKVEEPTETVKPTSDEPKPSSEGVPGEFKEEEEPIEEETKHSTEDVPSESQKEEETEPTESVKPTAEKPSYSGKQAEEDVPSEPAKPSAEELETEPTSEIPSGVGEYAKIAEGFLKKNTEGDSAEGDAGKSDQIGQYVKAAEGFLNKQSGGSADDESSKTGDSDQSGFGGVAKLAGNFFK